MLKILFYLLNSTAYIEMQRKKDSKLSQFESRLLKEIEYLDEKLRSLQDEKRTLSRLLAKARAENAGLALVTRKNSINRVLAENSIIASLKNSSSAISTGKLYLDAKTTNFDLKESTFRSYLHRMKNKGMIKASRLYARYWVLPDNNER